MSKRLSDIMGLEIINVYNGDKYGYLGDCDITFDRKTGEIKKVIASTGRASLFSFKNEDMVELPWKDKMRVFEKTIIFDYKV